MTQEEFIKELEKKEYSYEIVGDKIVVSGDYLYLNDIRSLPSNVVFVNDGDVYLNSLETLPSGVEFNNQGNINLKSLKTLPAGVGFKNHGDINLDSLKALPVSVEFKNGRWVNLKSLIGGWYDNWPGNIEGIYWMKLLNKMISIGLFDRK